MDVAGINLWISAGAGIVAIGTAVHGYVHAKARANRRALDALDATVVAQAATISVLEEKVRRHDESLSGIGRVHARIDEVAKSTAHIDGQLSQLNRSVGLLTEHLLSQK